jgi:hypothetical protein
MSNASQNNSNILHLESLIKQYDTLLIQYTQVQTDYINYLKISVTKSQSTSTTPNLVAIKGSTFWGNSAISSSNVQSVGQCTAVCSATSGCTGATYSTNSGTQNNCFLRGGDGDIISGTSNQYAIVSKNKEYLYTMQNLNSQLLQINGEIMQIIQTNKNTPSTENNDAMQKYDLLQKNFKQLEGQREKILSDLSQFQSLDEIQTQSTLTVNKNYYSFVLLLFLVLICIFFVSKIVLTSDSEKSEANMNVFVIIFSIFVITTLCFMLVAYVQKRQINFF